MRTKQSECDKTSNILARMPKIELHCHLDGSIRLELAQRLLAVRGEQYSLDELCSMMQAPEVCNDLSEYLRYFDLPNEILQQPRELSEAAYDLAMTAAQESVRYLEVRLAPYFSTAEGLSVGQVLEAVLEGLERAKRDSSKRISRHDKIVDEPLAPGGYAGSQQSAEPDAGPQQSAEPDAGSQQSAGIESRVIVCGMRGLSEQVNLSMLREAREFLGHGVVACDLAGNEKYYPLKNYAYFFEEAKQYGMPFTIHAGECGSRENIRMAIELGASRIGHGIAMYHDKELQRLCAQKRIGVELCPTSNLQTQAISSLRNYPLLEFMEAGVPVSVNTDNRTVSATSLTAEYAKLAEVFGRQEKEPLKPEAGNANSQERHKNPEVKKDCLAEHMADEDMYRRIYRDSVEMSFAPDEVKHRLLIYENAGN